MTYKTDVDGVKVESDFAATDKEIKKYLAYMATKHNKKIGDIEKAVFKILPGDNVDVDCVFRERKFERIRRITGYLVGTTDRWNDAKKAELRDRVKHA